MSKKTKTISYHNRVRFFWSLVAISILSLGVYVYAINTIARNVASRQDLEKQIVKMRAGLDSLEFAFVELKNNIKKAFWQKDGVISISFFKNFALISLGNV